MLRRPISLLAFLLTAYPVFPAVYSVVPEPETASVRVTVALESGVADRFRMPAWAPGDYRIVDFGQHLKDVAFFREGEPVEAVYGPDPNLWTVDGGADSVSYRVKGVPRGGFSENLRVKAEETFWNGPAVLGYFEGHKRESHTLNVRLVPEGARIECALLRIENEDASVSSLNTPRVEGVNRTRRVEGVKDAAVARFSAPDYDTLIDAPVVMGTTLRVHEFMVRNKPHAVVAFNRPQSVDLEAYAEVCADVVEQAFLLFGEFPYRRYLFLLDFGGPGGGLEHADCARMGFRPTTSARSASGLIAHEYFHAFNVKRIRPMALGPFDYARPAVTGALWWLEGVTEYYGEVSLHRAGRTTRADFLRSLSGSLQSLRRNSSRLRVSADEASRRVWETGGSSGFGGLSYYRKGKLIALCLDLAIRAESKGERSLDDVMAALFYECRGGKPGFAEGRIRELCVQFGGSALGPIYDRSVLETGDLPVEELLARLGLVWTGRGIQPDRSADPQAQRLGQQWPLAAAPLRDRSVAPSGFKSFTSRRGEG